jgi:hypothetical protein
VLLAFGCDWRDFNVLEALSISRLIAKRLVFLVQPEPGLEILLICVLFGQQAERRLLKLDGRGAVAM